MTVPLFNFWVFLATQVFLCLQVRVDQLLMHTLALDAVVSVDYCFAYTTLFPLVRCVDLTFVHFRGHSGCHSFPHDLSLQHFGAQVVFDVMSGPGKSMLTASGHLV